jgi:hypothetical protein
LLVTAFGVLVGFLLTSVSGWRENRRKLGYLRRQLYGDISWIYLDFKTLQERVIDTLENKEYRVLLKDKEYVDGMLDFYGKLLDDALKDDWYKNARADPHLFTRLSDNELRVITGNHTLLSKEAAILKADVLRAAQRRQVDEPKELFTLEKDRLERIIGALEKMIRGGLKKDEFLKISISEQDRADVALMFDDDTPPDKQKRRRILKKQT